MLCSEYTAVERTSQDGSTELDTNLIPDCSIMLYVFIPALPVFICVMFSLK